MACKNSWQFEVLKDTLLVSIIAFVYFNDLNFDFLKIMVLFLWVQIPTMMYFNGFVETTSFWKQKPNTTTNKHTYASKSI
jgi:hypothetical protein